MKCVTCGAPIDPEDKFCSKCGSPQLPVPPESSEPTVSELLEKAEENGMVVHVGEQPEPEDEPAEEQPEPENEPTEEQPEVTEEPVEDVLDVIDSALSLTEPEEIVQEDLPLPDPEPEELSEPEPIPVPDIEPENTGEVKFSTDNTLELSKPAIFSESEPEDPGIPDIVEFEQPKESEPKKEKSPEKVGALRIIGACIVSIIAALLLVHLNICFSVRLGVTGDILKKQLEKVDSHSFLSAKLDDDMRLGDAIYNELGFKSVSGGMVDQDMFIGYLRKISALNFAGDKLKAYTDYIMLGEGEKPVITSNEIVDFFEKNSDMADMVLPVKLQTSDYNKMWTRLEKTGSLESFSIDALNEKAHYELENTKYLLSYVINGILGVLFLVLMIWVAVIVKARGKHVLGLYSAVLGFGGGISLIVALAVLVVAPVAYMFTSAFPFYAAAHLLLPFGLVSLCFGGAEVILGIIFRIIRRRIRLKEKASASAE